MEQRTSERRLSDIRCLTEALLRALEDAAQVDRRISRDTVAEQLAVKRAYLSDALNVDHEELQFQARLLVPYCRIVGPLPIAWIADQLGFVLVPREHASSSGAIAMETLDLHAEAGQLARTVRDASRDGRLCEQDRSDIRDQSRRVQREAAEVERAALHAPVAFVTGGAR